MTTAGKKEFLYGRFEVRARIPVAKGAWPAIWMLGSNMEWPSCGEIDLMEYYHIRGIPHILANAAWGTDKKWTAKWDSRAIPYSHFIKRILIGLPNSIFGEWTGTKKRLRFIWMMSF